MKIIYGITKSNFGGAQRYVFDLALEARKAGHEVAVMCGEGGALVEKLKREGVRVITIPGFGRDMDLLNDAPRLWFIIKTVWREKPDVFHINSSKMGGAGIFVGRLLGIKHIIFTGHGWAFKEQRPGWQKVLIRFFSWLIIIGTHKTICVSEQTKRDIESWPFVKRKLVVVHNGIEPFELMPKTDHVLTVGTLAELHHIKGLDVLLKAWKKFQDKHPEAKLIIMGSGEERRNLEDLARELHITDSVEFRGYVENARQHLSNFDIFCLPSRSENLPYVILEAGFAGLPIVATRVGGIPEVITNGENGVLVNKENPNELFSSLLLLAEDRALRERLGSSIKQKILKDFSIQRMAENTFLVYSC